MCWSGNDDEAHDGRHNHGGQVGLITPGATWTTAIACYHQKCVADTAMQGNTFETDRQHHIQPNFMLYFCLTSGIGPQQGCGLPAYRLCTLPLCFSRSDVPCLVRLQPLACTLVACLVLPQPQSLMPQKPHQVYLAPASLDGDA